jgi:hypothetical protein
MTVDQGGGRRGVPDTIRLETNSREEFCFVEEGMKQIRTEDLNSPLGEM